MRTRNHTAKAEYVQVQIHKDLVVTIKDREDFAYWKRVFPRAKVL